MTFMKHPKIIRSMRISQRMIRKLKAFLILILSMGNSCQSGPSEGTFGYDVEILSQVEDLLILEDGEARIALSPSYQGRVFTSTSGGMDGYSYGYYNRKLILGGNAEQRLSPLGGESRMWFGPEVGKFGIFFEPGTPQTDSTIKVSPDLDTLKFSVEEQSPRSVTSGGRMFIRNASGTLFTVDAKRKITLLSRNEMEEALDLPLSEALSGVAFSAETWIRNAGEDPWMKESGLLSIWDLGCLHPSPNTVVIIPTRNNPDSVTIYFTPLDENRLQIRQGIIFYRADAQYMNKIGLRPEYASHFFGSYSHEKKQLHLVKFSFHDDSLYVNSLWGHKDPYQGDVINVFNGEVNPNLDRTWPFYELESSSSARELEPGDQMYHLQSIFHFEGNLNDLDMIAQKILGVSLKTIPDFNRSSENR